MSRYTKHHSNYIIRKRHQNIDGGTIFERDWSTIGERHVIETGKKRIYGDSGFLFTDNIKSGQKKRQNTGKWSEAFTLDDLTLNVNDEVNSIKLNESYDIRDYAYFGSATELIRSSIENIIKWFPGKIWSTNQYITKNNKNEKFVIKEIINDGHHNYIVNYMPESMFDAPCVQFTDSYSEFIGDECVEFTCDGDCSDKGCENVYNIYKVNNPFEINLYKKNVVFGKNDNRLRFMTSSWGQYLVNGFGIKSYDVWVKPYNRCDENYTICYDITITLKSEKCVEFSCGDDDCLKFDCEMPNVIHIYGLKFEDDIIWCTDTIDLDIRPMYSIIHNYFENLCDFEKKLLNRKSVPLYTTKFLTIKGNNYDEYTYSIVDYTWPSTGYCIDIDSLAYENYVNSLYALGEIFDEIWCDNIWRSMTHESIKNFDWTHTREYVEGEEIENIAGGTRMQNVLRVIGRCFDDIKRYIDGISMNNNIDYDSQNNMPNAIISDKLELQGFDVFSIKQSIDDNILFGDYHNDCIKWYPNSNIRYLDENTVELDFDKRLLLNCREIMKTKGTLHGIEMILGMFGIGEDDFSFEEGYYSVTPKKRDDIYYYYRPCYDVDEEYESLYTKVNSDEIVSLSDYIETLENIEDGEDHIKFVITIDGIDISTYYDKVGDMTLGQFLEYVNSRKGIQLNYYDDPYSGIPIGEVMLNNEYYIVPMFSQKQIYDGDVQFESDGGWGKDKYSDKIQYGYLETLPYIDILSDCSSLTSISEFDVKGKTIYYVADISDYFLFNQTPPTNLSNFFKLVNPLQTNNYDSWRNIPFYIIDEDENVIPADDCNPNDYNEYCSSIEAFKNVTYEDYKMAKYHNKMQQNYEGNNPHCGYGLYDLGSKYREYIEQPFKYAVENNTFEEAEYATIMANFTFDVEYHKDTKIINRCFNPNTTEEERNDIEEIYYLPSKILTITNNIDSVLYKKYFNSVIRNYLLQVIPSTTILILANFDETEE